MGLIAKLASFVRLTKNGAQVADVKLDPGGGAMRTAEHFSSSGDDSFPLSTDYVVTNRIEGTGRLAAVGYLDPNSAPSAQAGEKRIYARNPNSGATVAEVWLKNDGTVIVSNGSGDIELEPSGDVVINGVTISAGGNISGVNSLRTPTLDLVGHIHVVASAPGNTGPFPPIPGP